MTANQYESFADRSVPYPGLSTMADNQELSCCSHWHSVCSGLGIYDMKLGGQEVLEGMYVKNQVRTLCFGIPRCVVNRGG